MSFGEHVLCVFVFQKLRAAVGILYKSTTLTNLDSIPLRVAKDTPSFIDLDVVVCVIEGRDVSETFRRIVVEDFVALRVTGTSSISVTVRQIDGNPDFRPVAVLIGGGPECDFLLRFYCVRSAWQSFHS